MGTFGAILGGVKKVGQGLGHGVGDVVRTVARPIGQVVKEATTVPESSDDPSLYEPIDLSKYGKDEAGNDLVSDITLPTIDEKDPDYARKKELQDAYKELYKMHLAQVRAAGPEYIKELERMRAEIKAKPVAKKFSPWEAFAIGMGSQEGLKNVMEHNAGVDKTLSEREKQLSDARTAAISGYTGTLKEHQKYSQDFMSKYLAGQLGISEDRAKSDQAIRLERERGATKMSIAIIAQRGLKDKLERELKNQLDSTIIKGFIDQSFDLIGKKIDKMDAMGLKSWTPEEIDALSRDTLSEVMQTILRQYPNLKVNEVEGVTVTPNSGRTPAPGTGRTPPRPAGGAGGTETPEQRRARIAASVRSPG